MNTHDTSLLLGHFSDLHYSTERLQEADRCFAFAVQDAITRGCRMGVISGDSTDHRLDAHTPALRILAQRVQTLSQAMPVVMLQGTFSHEPPGTLNLFPLIAGRYPIYVADRIHQVALRDGQFVGSAAAVFDDAERAELIAGGKPTMVFTCVPTVNKGALAAAVGAAEAATSLGDYLADYLRAAGRVNRLFRAQGIPTMGISHGTVNGCQTEHGVPMAGFDHEFSLGALFDAECDGFMLGHIHRAQQWDRDGRTVAYPGSIGRFHYGEIGTKGYLAWSIAAGQATAELIPTPARETDSIEFHGPPDMELLAEIAATANGKFIRIRWTIDDEHRQLVDRDAILSMFSTAAEVKLEGRVLPIVRSRAEGISRAATLGEKLGRWGTLVDVQTGPLLDRLAMLGGNDPTNIADLVLQQLDAATTTLDTVHSTPPAALATEVETSAPLAPALNLDWLSDDLFAGEPA